MRIRRSRSMSTISAEVTNPLPEQLAIALSNMTVACANKVGVGVSSMTYLLLHLSFWGFVQQLLVSEGIYSKVHVSDCCQ